jgi:hypothetical protein
VTSTTETEETHHIPLDHPVHTILQEESFSLGYHFFRPHLERLVLDFAKYHSTPPWKTLLPKHRQQRSAPTYLVELLSSILKGRSHRGIGRVNYGIENVRVDQRWCCEMDLPYGWEGLNGYRSSVLQGKQFRAL